MHNSLRCILIISLLGCFLGQALPAQTKASEPVKVALFAEKEGGVAGEEIYLGLRFQIEPNWHIYWKNPGSSGYAISVKWTLPEGIEVGAIEWPAPKKFAFDGFINYGYSDVITLLVPMTISADFNSAEVAINAEVSWLACENACVPGSTSLMLQLPLMLGAGSETLNATVFRAARASLPVESIPWEVNSFLNEARLRIQVEDSDVQEVYFYAEEAGLVDADATQILTPTSDGIALEVELLKTEMPAMIEGVLEVDGNAWGVELKPAVRALPPTVSTSNSLESRLLDLGLSGWLVLAFLGGLILNVMPCVLPVLSLKVFSLLKHAGQSRGQAFAYGFAYTLGVVLSFVALAAALFVLRGLGERIGWGFQLQNPQFVVGLTLLLFLFALNLVGVFEMGMGLVGADAKVARRNDLVGSFGMGILAAVVGAPCVGPLVGGASGVALQVDPLTGISVFAMMGFGMAAPFLLLSLFPRLVSFLPKPGPWMEVFKQGMGFVLFAVVVFLLWVVGQSGGTNGILVLLLALFVTAIAAWVYGRWAAVSKPKKTRRRATIFALTLLSISLIGGAQSMASAYATSKLKLGDEKSEGPWQAWSEARVARELALGNPVFVDFTASWCLICQVNKRAVLRTNEIQSFFAEHDIVSLEADWTTRDAAITDALEAQGRSGVPLYLLHFPDGTTQVLPQNLTKAIVREAVEAGL
jgi:thiol:disulfide interchange protein DsbD